MSLFETSLVSLILLYLLDSVLITWENRGDDCNKYMIKITNQYDILLEEGPLTKIISLCFILFKNSNYWFLHFSQNSPST